jgi:hypothetical protein
MPLRQKIDRLQPSRPRSVPKISTNNTLIEASSYIDGSGSCWPKPANLTTLNAFKNFVVATVNHLPKGQQWEIWNEYRGPEFRKFSPSDYTALLETVFPAIKAADPTADIIETAQRLDEHQRS